ncbi:MAG TPA: hypothetical protein PLN19_05405 [Methanothrix sp.]|nr:hypothetical protein [Methanothrix sp.]HPC89905.1 hypothetical protein [Methanothrix sp.]HQE87695.1 hypothetical protein [Methanothrix sp.]HQI67490.1 hypothetical protein [Methanothrix sp.]HRS85270.1 hypothetical protein [Methanothrix sp.]
MRRQAHRRRWLERRSPQTLPALPRDPEALADAMGGVHLELIERMGRASRSMAEERFDVRRAN